MPGQVSNRSKVGPSDEEIGAEGMTQPVQGSVRGLNARSTEQLARPEVDPNRPLPMLAVESDPCSVGVFEAELFQVFA